MKFNLFIKAILLISSLGLLSCIYEEPFPELPAETHTGEGTFGCLVNNELVFALSRNWTGLDAGASYDRNNDQLRISAKCQFGQQFVFLIDDPYKRQDGLPIDTIRYLLPNSNEWMQATHVGSFRITRMDDNPSYIGVVSGIFSFDFIETGKTPIRVTKGRFDLTFYYY